MKLIKLNPPQKSEPWSTPARHSGVAISVLIIFSVISWFCAMTPWVADDFGFSKNDTGLWTSQVQEYMAWSGKFIGHFMSRVLLSGPKWLHPILTPIMFVLLATCGSILALGAQWKERLRAWHLITVAGLTWIALPAFGTVFFWRTGTPDYGYSLVWATLFLIPYRLWAEKPNFRLPCGICFVFSGMLAGWSNENVGMLALLVALSITLFRRHTSCQVPLWAAAGITGAALGWTMMMIAPGNSVRLAAVGGAEKIPLLSVHSLMRFVQFWSTEQLEMLPYFLTALIIAWVLHRRGQLKVDVWIPTVVFFLMAQASLGAFILSPSTPYRAMSATFFFAALCPFSLLVHFNPYNRISKAIFVVFCGLLLSSILIEARIFLIAQSYREQQHKTNLHAIDYPETDKYFFLGYDIREIDLYSMQWRDSVPWSEAHSLNVFDAPEIRAVVACNIVFLEHLPQGEVHVAARAHSADFSNSLQKIARIFFENASKGIITKNLATMLYRPASSKISEDGKAAVFIPGIKTLNDIAYIAVNGPDEAIIWKRVTPFNTGN